MSKLTKALTAAAGNAGESLYVEDVFSTYLYAGNSTAGRAIVNGIDLSGEGGLVWIKDRTQANSNSLFTTDLGANKTLLTDSSAAADTVGTDVFQAFNSNGFTVGSHSRTNINNSDYASWSFRKAEKFFDVVTYTGDGASSRTIAHSLGSVPAFMTVKSSSNVSGWRTYHASLGATQYVQLQTTAAAATYNIWNDTTPTDSVFSISTDVNANGVTYVAYLFASDAGGFGDDGDENIIKCGSYVGTGSATVPNHVELGFEPQYWLIKNTTRAADWWCIDTMRGADYSGTARLFPNTSGAEVAAGLNVVPTATGFDLYNNNDSHNRSGDTYIYIAIRRPMKTPESGTEVFSPSTYAGNDPTPTVITTGFPVDLALTAYRDLANAGAFGFTPRLTEAYLYSATNAVEVATGLAFDSNTSFATDANHWNQSPSNLIGYGFKRATGFMDVVAYTGANSNGNQSLAVNHNLGVVPEFIICKNRGRAAGGWISYHKDLNGGVNPQDYYIYLERTTAAGGPDDIAWGTSGGGGVAPTSTNFTVGGYYDNGYAGDTYISYLFATVAGVSKVGSYTGTGSDLNVDCGFSAGARFILIKRSDSTGDWYVWDSVRGISAGNDPYLLLNTTAAEVTNTDYVDPLASGFTVTSTAPAALNASGGSYIFLAIA